NSIPTWEQQLMRRKPAILLDRDGVINIDGPGYVESWDEFQFCPGALEAIRKLTEAGWELYVITNQSGVARGLYSEQRLMDIHWRMMIEIRRAGGRILGVQFCPHTDEAECMCRKPRPGMLLKAAAKWGLDLAQSYFVGDTARDIQAGAAVGCTTLWVQTHCTDERTQRQREKMVIAPDYEVTDLAKAVETIVARRP
ncbi:MAG: D-glycero-beta-D-manno-heptose 1,7-bisphosphate 7-phosphatase, partial [Armatimonadetes bacterium]|nr:D-glycero-beta-D-manno-heptose 1,7-bisphosphate 7-phosphatase [Armatimonadota bacterium]